MSSDIDLFRPVVSEEAIAAAGVVLRSGWPGPGALVEEFEDAFARYVGASNAVAVTSGTAGVHLAIQLLDPRPGDEVITSAITFVGANEAIAHAGCVPVFADVHPSTGLLDPASIEVMVSPRTVAILVTHLGGRPADLEAIGRIADRHGLAVLEDAAHACGSRRDGVLIGGHSGTQAFSFQATKNLTTIDGGMICTRSAHDATRAKRLRWMGIDRTTWERARDRHYTWTYDVTEIGHKYAMNDLNAAIGLAHLPLLETANARRRAILDRYADALQGLPSVEVVRADPRDVSATYLASLNVDDRDRLADELAAAGINTGVHFRRNDDHAVFGPRGDLPGAERYWRRTLSLPCHLELSDDDVDRVAETLGRSVAHHLVG